MGESESQSAAWDFSQKRNNQTSWNLKEEQSAKHNSSSTYKSNWNSQSSDAASVVYSSSSWKSTSSSGKYSGSSDHLSNQRFGPTLSQTGYQGYSWSTESSNTSSSSDKDFTPRFSGMNLGDVMRITVMQEAQHEKEKTHGSHL